MLEAIAHVLASEVFRGGALLTAVITGATAVILQTVKQGPELKKLKGDADEALRASTNAELLRLAERIDQSDRRHAECEQDRDADRKRIRELEEEITGLRRQIIAFQEANLRVFATKDDVPPDMKATLKVIK